MSPAPQVVVHRDEDVLAAAVAARLITALVDAQVVRGTASVVLTGGGSGIAVLTQVRLSPARDAVDWARVDVYWGDERFVPNGHADRNETQAREALLDHVAVDPTRVFPMAASDGPLGDDPERAAAEYARTLAEQGRGAPVPRFDVLLLGMGEEGHVTSVFPHSPAVREHELTVVAVRDCPKPPPTRISLTLSTVRAASQVWLCVAGEGKAVAVQQAVGGADEVDLPAAGARGLDSTLWMVDTEAAGQLSDGRLPPRP